MKVGFLGAGNLGRSIIDGLLNSKKYSKADFRIVVATKSSVANYQKEGFFASTDWSTLAPCALVILALRPDDIKAQKDKLASSFSNKQIIISVAAFVTLAQLREIFSNLAITRVMPNTSCQFNQSMSLITQEGSKQANVKAEAIFTLLGKTVFLPEAKMPVFIAICGSASAYLYYWLQPLMQLALEHDISLADSKNIIASLLVGVSANIAYSSASLAELQNQVTVPGGTTIEAIKVFDQSNIKKIIEQAIRAVAKRGQE